MKDSPSVQIATKCYSNIFIGISESSSFIMFSSIQINNMGLL
jgi:hypothetical protein